MPNKLKVLVAEDEKPLSKALNLKLTNAGYVVTVVNNGSEAIDALGKGSFDVMLLDLVMPVTDGFQVLTEIKNKKIKMPVIVLSNLGQDEDIKKAKSLGAFDFFVKASTPLSRVLEIISNALKK